MDWTGKVRSESVFRRYGTLFIFIALFFASWVGQFLFQLVEVANEAKEHGQEFMWSEFWPQFFSATFENWQSEFLQLAWQVGLVTLLAGRLFRAGERAEVETVKTAVREVLDERENLR